MYLEEYCVLMCPIALTLDHLQREKNISFGELIPALFSLRVKLKKLQINFNFNILKKSANYLEQSLIRRFKQYFYLEPEAYDSMAAAALCPWVKLNWFKAVEDINHNHDLESLTKLIENIIFNSALESGFEQEKVERAQENSFYDFNINQDESSNESRTQSPTENCFIMYLSDRNCASLKDLVKYPLLKQVSLKLNTPLTSSAPVERLFSFAEIINAPRRNGLSDEHFEKLVLLKANHHIFRD